LSRWLGRSKRITFPGNDADSAACALFGLDAVKPPAAALGYLADFSKPPPGTCFRLDPVHLRADISGLVLFAAESAGLGEDEARVLFEAIRPLLHEDGWEMRYGAADRWYISNNASMPVPVTHGLTNVVGQAISAYLPKEEGADDWLRRINELQMLLHGNEVNQRRAIQGQPLVNGLWLWGGGSLPVAGKAFCSQIQTNRSVLSGLAKLHGVAQLDKVAEARLLKPGGNVLVDLNACESVTGSCDVQRWCTALEKLEHDWFAPLLGLLMRGRIRQLDLLPLNGFRYPLRRSDLLAFWRGNRDYKDMRSGLRN